MREASAIDLLLLAPLCWDEIVDRSGSRKVPGGAGFYAAHALAKQGARVSLHTPLAERDRSLLAHLPPSTQVVVHPSRSTTRFRIELDPTRPNEREIFLLDRCDRFDSERVVSSLPVGSLLLGPLLPEDLDRGLLSLLRSSGVAVDLGVQGLVRSVDKDGRVVTVHPRNPEISPIRILSGDVEEILALAGTEDIDTALGDLSRDAAEEVIATRGDRGASIRLRDSNETIEIPAARPGKPIRHTVGLGDTFLAVYAWKRSQGSPPQAAGRSAAEAAVRLMEEGID
jgi:sugar/nucleoside kinase (ribokinase family)